MSNSFKSREKKREKQLIGDRPWISFPNNNDSKLTKRLTHLAIRELPLAHELKQKALTRWEIYDALNNASEIPFKLFMVGSCSNFTALKGCDLDLCLVFNKERSRKEILSAMGFFKKELQERCKHFTNFEIIKASVPVLRFTDSEIDTQIDLNINSKNSIRNSTLIRTYLKFDSRARALTLAIKVFARDKEINEAAQGGLSSYCLALMVIFYLQQCKVLPTLDQSCLRSLIKDDDEEKLLYIPSFRQKVESSNEAELGDLYRGFMKYYANFDWRDYVVCVRTGTRKLKWRAIKHRTEPTSWGPLCLEDPLSRVNASKSVQLDSEFNKIISAFRQGSS